MSPTMIVLAGPNGAGKSTLYAQRVAPIFSGPFINADLIQRDELNDPAPAAAYKAAEIAAARRAEHLERRDDFVTETVFSHASKLDLIDHAKAQGFTVIVMHVGVETDVLSVARVAARVGEGGHQVPEDKIRERFQRSTPLIRAAVLKADCALIYDNSLLNQPPRHCLTFANGRISFALPLLPKWVLSQYGSDLTL